MMGTQKVTGGALYDAADEMLEAYRNDSDDGYAIYSMHRRMTGCASFQSGLFMGLMWMAGEGVTLAKCRRAAERAS
jgi:hypothetical protein